MKNVRAFIRQNSGLHLDLMNPSPEAWTDEDLAISLSRTFRWGGHSIHPLPLSVAQHSLTVLALSQRITTRALSPAERLRELLHDAEEGLIGGFDPVSPLKPFLGSAFADLSNRLQAAVFERYGVTAWSPDELRLHKDADILAAASEAIHVAGWSQTEIKDVLGIQIRPLIDDPLSSIFDTDAWTPWAPTVAAERFLTKLRELVELVTRDRCGA